MKLYEFKTSSSQKYWGLELFAWTLYNRGDIPTSEEIAEIVGRVAAKFPKAELVSMHRSFMPVGESKEPTKVWWEFKWIDFSRKERGAK